MTIFLLKALQLVAALSLLVLVHELGHYTFARIFKIRVEKFYLFFNPYFSILKYNPASGTLQFGTWTAKDGTDKALATWRVGTDREAKGMKISAWRRTVYGLGWLPLGGYCAIAGMIDETHDAKDLEQTPQDWEFRSKPAWQRLLVMIGGVLFNFLMAVAIYIGIAFSWGEQTVKFTDAYAGLDYVESAQKVGFRNGDIPLTADGRTVDGTEADAALRLAEAKVVTVLRNGCDTVSIPIPKEFILDLNDDKGFFAYRVPVFVKATQKGRPAQEAGLIEGDHIVAIGDSIVPSYTELHPALMAYAGEQTTVTVERDGRTVTMPITPAAEDGMLGFQLMPITEIYPVEMVEYTLLQSVPKGWQIGTTTMANYVGSMKHLFSRRGVESIGGFGSLGNLFSASGSWFNFWMVTAFLSVALAFMNIIPIPALDGGHVLFLLYEIVTRRQPSMRFLEVAQYLGMGFLLLLMVWANLNDILRL